MKGIFLVCALALAGALGLACGASTPSANDQTTVTVEKPADSSIPPPLPAASGAPAK
ncbi:MAG TPA: hypothetical protein VIF15_17785 [Polyangiaceae bacterium]|jgi:hypothetical protein